MQSLIYAGQLMEDDKQLQNYNVPGVSCCTCWPLCSFF